MKSPRRPRNWGKGRSRAAAKRRERRNLYPAHYCAACGDKTGGILFRVGDHCERCWFDRAYSGRQIIRMVNAQYAAYCEQAR